MVRFNPLSPSFGGDHFFHPLPWERATSLPLPRFGGEDRRREQIYDLLRSAPLNRRREAYLMPLTSCI